MFTFSRCGFHEIRVLLAAALGAATIACASAPKPPPPPPGPSAEQKTAWILRLEDQRVLRDPAPPPPPPVVPPRGRKGRVAVVPAPPPVPDLIALLSDPDPRMRRRAALAVGRVGLADGVGPLTTLLADADTEVKQMAAFALGLIGDTSAAEPLEKALADPSPVVQGSAAQALGAINATTASAAIGQMVARARQDPAIAGLAPDDERFPAPPAAEAFRLGLYALVRLKAYDALAAAVLDGSGQPLVTWWPVAFALQRIEDPRAAPALMTLLSGPSRYGQAFAIKGLGALKHAPAVSLLVPVAANAAADPMLGVEAVRALGRIADATAVPTLMAVATNPAVNHMIRSEAVAGVGSMHAKAPLNLLIDLMSDTSPLVRAAALRSVAQIEGENFVTLLSGLDPDRQWTARAALASVLGTLNPAVGVPRLTGMLTDEDQRVVPPVLTALATLHASDVDKILLERLKSDDYVIRTTAANLLGDLKPAGGAEALVAAYQFGERDPTYVARAAALASLAKYGGALAIETLQTALKDKDWALRVRAAELLKPLGPSVDAQSAIRPAPSPHPLEYYSTPRLVAPTVSPHAYIDTDKGTIEIELNVVDAPLTSDNFMTLARRGFFNGIAIHRVVPNFVVQDGDPRGDGEGGPGYTIRDELSQLPYVRGTVGMALDWRDTGGSQFFITHSPQPHLDARYTVFGHVVNGMEVVDRIEPWDVIRRVRIWDGAQMTER